MIRRLLSTAWLFAAALTPSVANAWIVFEATQPDRRIVIVASVHAWPSHRSDMPDFEDLAPAIEQSDGVVFESDFWNTSAFQRISAKLTEQMNGRALDEGILSEASVTTIRRLSEQLPRHVDWSVGRRLHPLQQYLLLSCESRNSAKWPGVTFDPAIYQISRRLGRSVHYAQDADDQFFRFANADIKQWNTVFAGGGDRLSCSHAAPKGMLNMLADYYAAGADEAAFRYAVTESEIPWMPELVRATSDIQARYVLALNHTVKRLFVVLGWSHLIGENSVIARLRASGYAVSRCDGDCASVLRLPAER